MSLFAAQMFVLRVLEAVHSPEQLLIRRSLQIEIKS